MSCLNSFTILSSANENIVAPNITTWGLAPQNYWLAQSSAGTSTFNIQGYQLINIHAIEAVGNVTCLLNTGNSVIVNDWSFYLQVAGQNALASGNIVAAPNRFSIQIQGPAVSLNLSRYNPKIEFASPIKACSNFQITGFQASGIGAQSLANINLAWNINFVIYYSYENQ